MHFGEILTCANAACQAGFSVSIAFGRVFEFPNFRLANNSRLYRHVSLGVRYFQINVKNPAGFVSIKTITFDLHREGDARCRVGSDADRRRLIVIGNGGEGLRGLANVDSSMLCQFVNLSCVRQFLEVVE
jgi:hypothetical protein